MLNPKILRTINGQCFNVFLSYVKAANKVLVKLAMFLTMLSIHLKLMRKHLRKTLPLDTKTMDMNLDTTVKALGI